MIGACQRTFLSFVVVLYSKYRLLLEGAKAPGGSLNYMGDKIENFSSFRANRNEAFHVM